MSNSTGLPEDSWPMVICAVTAGGLDSRIRIRKQLPQGFAQSHCEFGPVSLIPVAREDGIS